MRTLRISVRRLVEFLLRTGDIDAQRAGRGGVEVMQVGSEIHRRLQAQASDAYQAEVALTGSFYFPDGAFNPYAARLKIPEASVAGQAGFFLRVEGRADGIIDDGKGPLTIDEIKGVTRDVSSMDAPVPVHEAQALSYAYLYLRSRAYFSSTSRAFGDGVRIRLTYASMDTGELRRIERVWAVPDIEERFFSLLEGAGRWAAWRIAHDERRDMTLSALSFPFEARAGQAKMMDAVSSAIAGGARLYVQAPTGSGKTIAALFPALKALGKRGVSRVVYLTAKTMTRRTALQCLELVRKRGADLNVLVVTARAKICPLMADRRATDVRTRPLGSPCNPYECPLARGHFDRANDALFEAISDFGVLVAERLSEVAARHHVCPYELERDATRWADVIICDYHYAFAPSSGLFGLSAEPGDAGTVLLVDEAHNLVERMREMYSAELTTNLLGAIERLMGDAADLDELRRDVHAALGAFPTWDKALQSGVRARSGKGESRALYQRAQLTDDFEQCLSRIADGTDAALEGLSSSMGQTGAGSPSSAELYLGLNDLGLAVRGFLSALSRAQAGYVTFLSPCEKGGRRLKVYCVDPRRDLDERLGQDTPAVFFSGTLLPMDYHRRLLAARDEDASLDVESGFDSKNLQVFVGTDVSARYSDRGPALYARIAAYLEALTRAVPGNHLVFLPSYEMLDKTFEALRPRVGRNSAVVRQRRGLKEHERERFVDAFTRPRAEGASLIGLCVLGGIFGESIDLPGDALVGVVVVGTGMPRACAEREVIRDHFDKRGERGFAYAYTIPGLIKVLQAAGRLIRTESDHGTILLLDDRHLESDLADSYPKEWKPLLRCTLETLPALLVHGQAAR